MELLQDVSNLRPMHVLVMGDFNYKETDWEIYESMENESPISSLFMEGVMDSFLFQQVKELTRYREGQEPSILDLIFTNEENI